MKNFLFLLLFVAIILPASLFATTETFQLTTDASGNVTAADTISFGKLTLQNFSSTHAFANVTVKVDGTAAFSGGVAANTAYTVNGTAKSKFELVGTGGPANTTVTITINYTFSPVREESSLTGEEAERTSETFQLTTDGNGNVSASESVSFGRLTLQSFSVSHAFANAQIKVDGTAIFNAAVSANGQYSVNGTARSKFELIATGGPANTTVTVTIQYTFSPVLATDGSRTSESFQLTTDGSGNVSATENISFGKLTLQSFTCTYAFAQVQVKVDSTAIFNSGVAANVKYTVNGTAKSKFELIATGGPANTAVTVTVEYTFSPFRTDGSRDTDSFELTTDAKGNVTASEKISFGTFKLQSFTANKSFGNVKVRTDGVVRFDKAVNANGKEIVNTSAKKLFELIATQGPPSTKVVVGIEYTFSPVLLFSNIRNYCEWKAKGTTDNNGDVYVRDKTFDACHKVTLWGFNTNIKFNRIMLTVDDTNITPEPVEGSGGKNYLLNIQLLPGKHNISVLAEGGTPNQEAVFDFLHKE